MKKNSECENHNCGCPREISNDMKCSSCEKEAIVYIEDEETKFPLFCLDCVHGLEKRLPYMYQLVMNIMKRQKENLSKNNELH